MLPRSPAEPRLAAQKLDEDDPHEARGRSDVAEVEGPFAGVERAETVFPDLVPMLASIIESYQKVVPMATST